MSDKPHPTPDSVWLDRANSGAEMRRIVVVAESCDPHTYGSGGYVTGVAWRQFPDGDRWQDIPDSSRKTRFHIDTFLRRFDPLDEESR